MSEFIYATKEQTQPVKENLEKMIHQVQNYLRFQGKFTFQYKFIGSSARKMITYNPNSNIGFDFDINIEINDEDENYSAKEIKTILMDAFNHFSYLYYYKPCEDSTRVFTIKSVDSWRSKILYSCDFAIVNNYYDEHGIKHQQYIRYNKKQRSYVWAEQPNGYQLKKRIDYLKHQPGAWNEVRDMYLYLKNTNTDSNKHSRSIFAETINNMWKIYNN